MDHQDCPFCSINPERVVFSTTHGQAIWDAYPVSPGHILIVPRRHASTWDELTDIEKSWAWSAVDQAIAVVRSRHSPNGFNVGFNLGSAAGQTVLHFHLHVIPRYTGDVDDPRGGIRHVILEKPNYLDKGDNAARNRASIPLRILASKTRFSWQRAKRSAPSVRSGVAVRPSKNLGWK